MRKYLFICCWLIFSSCFAESIKVVTWNLHNFPSGVYNLRNPAVEPANLDRAAEVIRAISPDVLLLQEIRDEDSCRQLAERLKPQIYHVAVCSSFEDTAGIPLFQQVAILSKQEASEATWEKWRTFGLVDPPRGFAYAVIDFGNTDILFYSLHLKSNLVMGGERNRTMQLNILKRELAVDQVLRHVTKVLPSKTNRSVIVVGGDFNTNKDDPMYASERTLHTLQDQNFSNCFDGLPLSRRVTYFSKSVYPDATFDYVFFRNAQIIDDPMIYDSDFSDHRPVICNLQLP